MYSRSHLVISALLGAAVALAIGATPGRLVTLVAYAALVGTAIDLDHFLVARIRAGDWRHLRFAVANPRAAFLEQDELFEEGDVGPQTRLLSHALIAGLLVGGLATVDAFLALVTALVLYAHVLADLVAGVRQYEPLGRRRRGPRRRREE